MYGPRSSYEIPALNTYEKALAHYESIKPIRGKDWLRPIIDSPNGRRRKHMQIIKQRDGSVACRLYDTNVLTFLPDGEIHFTNGGYATTTTHQFATAILGWALVHIHGHRDQTCIKCGKKSVLVEDHNPIKLRWNADVYRYDFIDPPKMYAYYLKRAPMWMRRKEIEPFTKYVLALAKLVDPQQYDRSHCRLTAGELYQMVRSNDEWHDAADFLLRRCCTMRGDWTNRFLSILPKDITNMLDDMLKYIYAEDLFEQREVDKPNTNDNETYMTGAGTYL
jgi:hypothetical protein